MARPRCYIGSRPREAPKHDMSHTASSRTVCVVGQHELDYPRNVINQRLMRAAGYEIVLCHDRGPTLLRTLWIVARYLKMGARADVVFATEGAHRHVPWVKLFARLRGQ